MRVDLTEDELETILQSLEYSKERVRDAQGTPYEVRQQNLERIERTIANIRNARQREAN